MDAPKPEKHIKKSVKTVHDFADKLTSQESEKAAHASFTERKRTAEVYFRDLLEKKASSRNSLPERLSASGQARLDRAVSQADKSILPHVKGGEQIRSYKVKGEAGELLVTRNLDKAQNLNDSLKVNSAVYDVSTPHEYANIKTYALKENGSPNYPAYRKAMQRSIGVTAESGPYKGRPSNMRAAEELFEAKQEGGARWKELQSSLPSKIRNADSVEAMSETMAEYSTLRISPDQVDAVRENIHEHIVNNPETWDLSPHASQAELVAQADSIVRRVQPIDDTVTADHITAAIETQAAHRAS